MTTSNVAAALSDTRTAIDVYRALTSAQQTIVSAFMFGIQAQENIESEEPTADAEAKK